MRTRSRGLIAALTLALVTAAGCTAGQHDTDPAPSSSVATPASPTASALTDILVRDVSITTILDRTKTTLGVQFSVKLVPAGEAIDCTLGTFKVAVVGDITEAVHYCNEGYVSVPVAVTRAWQSLPAIVIWYYVARSAAGADPVYRTNNARSACAAAFVASRKFAFKHEVDGEQLLKFITDKEGAAAAAFVNAGLTVAKDNKPADTCKTAGT